MKDPIVIAQAIYDRPGDLVRHEQEFLSAVHRITMECAHVKCHAMSNFGDGSKTHLAIAYAADDACKLDLAAALARYEAACERIEA